MTAPFVPTSTDPLAAALRPHVALLYMQLGGMQYEVSGPVFGLESQSAAKLAEHAVIEGKPRLHRIGDELETITLTLELHSVYCDVASELASLKDAKANGQALPLVFANGTVRGRFVIAQLDEAHKQHSALGDPIAVSVRVQLKEWVEDQVLEVASRRKRADAPAVAPKRAPTATAKPGAVVRGGDPHSVPTGSIIRGRP